jgi:hypothetical protein
MTPTFGEQAQLKAQLERAREAMRAPAYQKVSLVLAEMPGLVDRLERVDLYQTEIRDLRKELVERVLDFQNLVRDEMRKHPGTTYANAHIARAANAIDHVLSRIAEFVGP